MSGTTRGDALMWAVALVLGAVVLTLAHALGARWGAALALAVVVVTVTVVSRLAFEVDSKPKSR